MLSTTTLQSRYGSLTNDTSTANKALGLALMNDKLREICAEESWDFLEQESDITTVADQQFYDLPYNYEKLITVKVTIGSTSYFPVEAPNKRFWDVLNQTTVTSDIPQFYFIFNGQIGLYPRSASASNTITVTQKRNVEDLVNEDYSTGSISAIANDDTTITGSGTTFTASMVGRYLRITKPTGDGHWYKIDTFTSTTEIDLEKAYQGTTITGGSASYTIGEMPILPEAFHMLLVYHACMIYFSTKSVDNKRYSQFKELYDNSYKALKKAHGRKSTSVVVVSESPSAINPNLAPESIG